MAEHRRLDSPALALRPRWLVKMLLVAAGVGLSLAVAEGAVRVAFPHSRDTAIPGHLFVIDDVLGWKFRPNARTVHRTRYFTVEYLTDSSGFRDEQLSSPPAQGVYRILLYGDSLMFGWGVQYAD